MQRPSATARRVSFAIALTGAAVAWSAGTQAEAPNQYLSCTN